MKECILAIDQGTTGTTCLVVGMNSSPLGSVCILGRGYASVQQYFPRPGWVEHDLAQIWDATTRAACEALEVSGCSGKAIGAIGITNQRETTGVWDDQGVPAHRAIVWQDRRTADRCRALAQEGKAEMFSTRTGLLLDPYFSGPKIAWLLEEVDGLRQRASAGRLRFGTIDTWLLWKLTAGAVYATDATNAGRTLLFDIHENRFDPELCAAMGLGPRHVFPDVRGCAEIYGHTRGLEWLPDGIPIAGVAGDQHAAMFGQACVDPGMGKCTYGTGAFVLLNTGTRPVRSRRNLLTTIAWRLGEHTTYALEGSAFVAGGAIQWLRDGMGLFASSDEVEALASQVTSSEGVVFVPALTGLGAPHWRPDAKGMIWGITRGTTRAHVARAALEGIAWQICDLLEAMQDDIGAPLQVLRVDGGAAANDLLLQFQADILGVAIHRPTVLETTALGAAFFAACGVGMMSGSEALRQAWTLERAFRPTMAPRDVQERAQRWREAVSKA